MRKGRISFRLYFKDVPDATAQIKTNKLPRINRNTARAIGGQEERAILIATLLPPHKAAVIKARELAFKVNFSFSIFKKGFPVTLD